MRRVIPAFFVFLLIFINRSSAQDWVNMMQNPAIKVQDVQNAFYQWYAGHEKEKQENHYNNNANNIPDPRQKAEEANIELFKRWEAFMIPRSYPSGARANP